ncbi:hypothetical protein ACIHCM_01170 [Streptomyces sp. NPDC052023]|uniref:hypothetical protein n=1 Tax=Streptomyces sp. NPDC052023 TaxID=3365681 RepID=UPI0037D0AE58
MNPFARRARAEWGRCTVRSVRGCARGGHGPVPLALAGVCLTTLLHFAHGRSWGHRLVENAGTVRAEDPFWAALLRTPLSLFVPALDLPVWGALAQILLVFGVAEICLGRWRALALA